MKELITIKSNFFKQVNAVDKFHMRIEVVLILGKTVYVPNGSESRNGFSGVNSKDETSTVRFSASPEEIRALSVILNSLAAEAEYLETK